MVGDSDLSLIFALGEKNRVGDLWEVINSYPSAVSVFGGWFHVVNHEGLH